MIRGAVSELDNYNHAAVRCSLNSRGGLHQQPYKPLIWHVSILIFIKCGSCW